MHSLVSAVVGVALLGTLLTAGPVGPAVASDPCAEPVDVIACENSKPGTPPERWDITGVGDRTVQGFATSISLDAGETVQFKIDTTAPAVRIELYRTGYYGGDGARLMGEIGPGAVTETEQPECFRKEDTGLVDCGNWSVSAQWAIPADAVSGVYIARLIRTDTQGASHVPFIVRNDRRTADIVFQMSDTTWQAYNWYGGESLYRGALPRTRAYEVSYNRPFETREVKEGRDFYFSSEYAMVQFLEANGYDVTYVSGLDVHEKPQLASSAPLFITVGHDEYWSGPQRTYVEAARDTGTNLAFFSGNEIYWRIRWEQSSVDGTGELRTVVCYKETWATSKSDPSPEWTGTWRDHRFDAEGAGNPENALTGSLYRSNSGQYAIEVPAEYGRMRLWRDTAVADLADGEVGVLAPNALGYEFNEDMDNGFRPEGLIRLSRTTKLVDRYLADFGNTLRPAELTHSLVMYRAPSGALVFGAGSIQWAWGYGYRHDGVPGEPDLAMRQATVNLFADMGVQPSTLTDGLVRATASTDTEPPQTSIIEPGPLGSAKGTEVTVRGAAADRGGGRVAGVEVSTDGGYTWQPADGREEWSFTFNPGGSGLRSIVARSIDDSGNIGPRSTGVVIFVHCPCSAMENLLPGAKAIESTMPVTVGTVFRSAVPALVTGMRMYRGPGNDGPHEGWLWTSDGVPLATATFDLGGSVGWQSVTFSDPVAIAAGQDYVVGYHAPAGAYAAEPAYFTAGPRSGYPLTLVGSVQGFGGADVFPTLPGDDENLFVDPIIETTDVGTPTDAVAPSAPRSVVSMLTGWLPTTPTVEDVNPFQVGVLVRTAVTGDVRAVRFYRATGNAGPHRGFVWGRSGELLASVTFDEAGQDGWQRAELKSPVRVKAGEEFIVSYLAPSGRWSVTEGDLLYPLNVGPLTALRNVYAEGAQERVPDSTRLGANYGVDLEFVAADDGPIVAPAARSILGSSLPEEYASPGAREVGNVLRFERPTLITGIRAFFGPDDAGPHEGTLRSADGEVLATLFFARRPAPGWQRAVLAQPVEVGAGQEVIVSYSSPQGSYALGPVGPPRSSAGSVVRGVTGSLGAVPTDPTLRVPLVDVLVRP